MGLLRAREDYRVCPAAQILAGLRGVLSACIPGYSRNVSNALL